MNQLAVEKERRLAQIESEKTKNIIQALGTGTIKNIADSRPKCEVRMLEALGIHSTLISDGKTPVNLYRGVKGDIQPIFH